MSPMFAEMLDDLNEESEVITLDFAEEATFALAIDFCAKSGFSEQ